MIPEAAAFVLGLSGSGHCLSMCGPLVLYVSAPRVRSQIAYHAGRVTFYAALGAVAGATGAVVAAPVWRNALAIATGLALLCVPWTAAAWPKLRGVGWLTRSMSRGVGAATGWTRRHHLGGPVVFGAINGLLPCGWLYVALAAAAGLAEPSASTRFMVAFGLGTVPALVALRLLPGHTLNPAVLRRVAPWASAVVGLLLIARGFGLGFSGHLQQHDHFVSHVGLLLGH